MIFLKIDARLFERLFVGVSQWKLYTKCSDLGQNWKGIKQNSKNLPPIRPYKSSIMQSHRYPIDL